jgi:hypothetical protein
MKKTLLTALLLVFATSAFAGDVDPCQSTVAIVGCAQMRVSICPAGDFEFIREGCGGTSDYIEVFVRDVGGVGIPGIPWSDYWLDACDPAQELCLCAAPIVAQTLTDSAGRTTIEARIAGGGCILTGGIYIAIQGKIVQAQPGCTVPECLNMIIVSPDLNVNCEVELGDLGIFGLSYNVDPWLGGYNDCCDFNDDNYCNLSDLAFMGEHYQHECF